MTLLDYGVMTAALAALAMLLRALHIGALNRERERQLRKREAELVAAAAAAQRPKVRRRRPPCDEKPAAPHTVTVLPRR